MFLQTKGIVRKGIMLFPPAKAIIRPTQYFVNKSSWCAGITNYCTGQTNKYIQQIT
jgi:hypothetical protein